MGTSAFSEIENQNVRDFLAAHKDTIKYYVNLHSYSQLVLLPWGYTKDPMPVYDRYLEVANRVSHLKLSFAFLDNIGKVRNGFLAKRITINDNLTCRRTMSFMQRTIRIMK